MDKQKPPNTDVVIPLPIEYKEVCGLNPEMQGSKPDVGPKTLPVIPSYHRAFVGELTKARQTSQKGFNG